MRSAKLSFWALFYVTIVAVSARRLHKSSPPRHPHFDTVFEFLGSRPDLSLVRLLVSKFPDLMARFLDPKFKGTVFFPNDEGIMSLPGSQLGTTYRQVVLSLLQQFDPVLTPLLDDRDSGVRRYFWSSLYTHILPHVVVTGAEFRPENVTYNTAVNSGMRETLELSLEDGRLTVYGNRGLAIVVVRDIRVGRAVVHIIDTFLQADVAPPDSFSTLADYSNYYQPSFGKIVNASRYTSWLVTGRPSTPMTVFLPTEEAIAKYLRDHNVTLKSILEVPAKCDAFLEAHMVLGQTVWLWDLATIALMPTGQLKFMNGKTVVARVSSNLEAAVVVQFDGGQEVKANVSPPVDFGGNDFGCSMPDCVDFNSVVHEVDRVLLP